MIAHMNWVRAILAALAVGVLFVLTVRTVGLNELGTAGSLCLGAGRFADLVVQERPVAQLTDELISRHGVSCIRKHVPIVISGLKVIVQAGHVTLQGRVSLAFLSTRAEKLVRELPGVTGLTNQIVVTPASAANTESNDSALAAYQVRNGLDIVEIHDRYGCIRQASDRWPRRRSDRPADKAESSAFPCGRLPASDAGQS